MNEDHEHDEDGNCIEVQGFILPSWRFSMWDVAGIATTWVAGLFTVTGQAGNLLAREFSAAANYSRANADMREAHEIAERRKQEMAEELRTLVEGDWT